MHSTHRFLTLALLWLVAGSLAQAGTPVQVFLYQEGDNDDNTGLAVATNLRWYSGAEPQFFYIEHNSSVLGLGDDGDFTDGDVIQAITSAIGTWNGAHWASGKNKFGESLRSATMLNNLAGLPYGTMIRSAEVDGINTIDFQPSTDNYPDSSMIGETWLSYFWRDFSIDEYARIKGVPLEFTAPVLSGSAGETRFVAVNAYGNFTLFLPWQNFKAGEVFDADILFNPDRVDSMTVLDEDVSNSEAEGELDIQALMTHQLGWARCVGDSLIHDSAMYPWTSDYQPLKRRQLSFDDQMTVAITDGTNVLTGDLGAISGEVLNGAVAGATVDGDGTTDDTTEEDLFNLFVVQAPVYLALPVQKASSVAFLKENYDPTLSSLHPDNIVSDPLDSGAVTYRLLAQVLTGQSLAFPVEVSTTAYDDGETEDDQTDTGDDTDDTDTGLPADLKYNINSNYLIPCLPAKDEAGDPVKYAIYLGDLSENPLNEVQAFFNEALAPETYDPEWYGGPTVAAPFGTGTATQQINTADDLFENTYLSVQIDGDGRVAAAINDGPTILSGFGTTPRSYLELTQGSTTYSNASVPLATSDQGVTIKDAAGSAQGSWEESGKFRLSETARITDQGGLKGIPAGIEVIYTVQNITDTTQSMKLRQVLDTQLWGRENPIYMVDDQVTTVSRTFTGSSVPSEIVYQSSMTDPLLRGFITLSTSDSTLPDTVAIGTLSELEGGKVSGTSLRGINSEALDSGVALTWGEFQLQPNESKVIRYIVGFLPPGDLHDTWLALPTDTTTLTGMEDDPDKITTVEVTGGEVHDGIDIITNNGTSSPDVPAVREGSAAGSLKFVQQSNAFPQENLMTTGGALGDIDGDGDLDLVTSNTPGVDSNGMNRVYVNQEKINSDGSVTRYFEDLTLGEDGVIDTADDRIDQHHIGESTVGTVLADFDGDGDLDLFFTNQSATNRYYENMGPEQPGFFVDETAAVLPQLLNGNSVEDLPFRATAGDIDGDGDMDLVITELEPFWDFRDYPDGSEGSRAWVDAAPRSEEQPVGDQCYDATADYITLPLRYSERILINQINVPPYAEDWASRHGIRPNNGQSAKRGMYFIDETLGTDDMAGAMSSMSFQLTDDYWKQQSLVSWDPSEIDRMPPIFPAMFHVGSMNNGGAPNGNSATSVASPMGYWGVEPHLGPFFGSTGLDLFSVRAGGITFDWSHTAYYTGALPSPGETDPPAIIYGLGYFSPIIEAYGTQQGYFRNMDLFDNATGELGSDGIPDGFFACMNYNMDFGAMIGEMVRTNEQLSSDNNTNYYMGSGLFVYEPYEAEDGQTILLHDSYPLFIGMPQGHPGDYTPTSGFEGDLVDPVDRSAWAGVVADWQNDGSPRPFVATDTDWPMYTSTNDNNNGSPFSGPYLTRGQYDENVTYGGLAQCFIELYSYPYAYNTWDSAVVEWPVKDVTPVQTGEPFSIAAGDFDHDGSQDVFIVNSSKTGMSTNTGAGGFTWQFTDPGPNQVLLNDGFANFTEANVLNPNPNRNGLGALVGDIDNDGDLDLIALNAYEPSALYINQIYTSSPNLSDQDDPTLFYEASSTVVPELSTSATTPGHPGWSNDEFSGLTMRSTVTDLNMDGKPDLVLAEGGALSINGDQTRLMLNTGKPQAEGVKIFQPANSAYPKRIATWNQDGLQESLANSIRSSYMLGYVGQRGFIMDVATGDADNDNDPDVFIAASGDGPQLLLNQDSGDVETGNKLLNPVPDANSLGDGILTQSLGLPTLDNDRKNLNRRIQLADFNGDRAIDVVIANGLSASGAENVLLLNSASSPGTFTDVTESNLPTTGTAGSLHGIFDNTMDVGVGDFDSDGDVDLVFANDSLTGAKIGFRMLLNNGAGKFTDTKAGDLVSIPEYMNHTPYSVVVGDFDGLGEQTEDKNFNGILDPGEDSNGNGVIDWVDRDTETEDANGNGVLDSGEDGLIAADGVLNERDLNGDGVYTFRRAGKWDGSLDMFVSFDNTVSPAMAILVNDPANIHPGHFLDQTSVRFAADNNPQPNRCATAGDIDLDGDLDIVVAEYVGGLTYPVKIWQNNIAKTSTGYSKGYFKDISYEVPYPRGVADFDLIYPDRDVTNRDEILGAQQYTFTGWAHDVSLIDYDGDGDLDLFVATLGTTNMTDSQGALDIFYVNRLIGDGFNQPLSGVDTGLTSANPVINSVSPTAAKAGATVDVTLSGTNFTKIIAATASASFKASLVLSFGDGISVLALRASGGQLVATIKVDSTATVGPRAVTIQNPSGGRAMTTKMGTFNVLSATSSDQDYEHDNAVPDRIWSLYN